MDSAEKSGARAESGNAGANTAGSKRAASPRERIVRSAAKLFLEKGYDKVSINDIIDVVGGSKGTIYSHFGSKEKLFEAVVEQMCADVTIQIDTRPIGTIEEQLTRIGHTFVSNVVSPPILRFHRLMTSIGRDFPAAGRLFYDTGPRQAQKMIGDWIALHQRAGDIRDDVDAYRLAVLFHDMLIGEQHLSWLTSAVSDKERNKRIDETVRLSVTVFLQGCTRR
ncbi:TetR/AcrR family transcriptional regulator [Microbacteriaceae bacterium K1510]|nr:TetR/AcrR family transcriptional regulator [Microbacteriaceae bacterium K1510]